MKKTTRISLSILVMSLSFITSFSQGYTTIDVVRVDERYAKEASYFYDENWVKFRKAALGQGFISGYKMVKSPSDSTNHYHLILITEYADSLTFHRKEENFSPIMKKISPNGPRMLNEIPRSKFLEYLSGYEAFDIVEDRKKK